MHASIDALRTRLQDGPPLLLDAAVGTELTRWGFSTRLPLWSASALEDEAGRELVGKIHAEHVAVGAEILLTNTFRANLVSTACRQAARDLVAAALPTDRPSWGAVSVGPLGDCYQPALVPETEELEAVHGMLAEEYRDAPLVWFETMGSLREIECVARLRRKAAPSGAFVLSFCIREDGALLSGEPLEEAVTTVTAFDPLAFGLNCIPPAGATMGVTALRKLTDRPIAAYAHIGNPEPILGWSFSESIPAFTYAEYAQEWIAAGAQIVGGCCGTTAAHIAAIAEAVRS